MASRRPRKSDRGVTDYNALLSAIKDIKVEKKSIRSTASAFKIDKSSLSRYVTKFDKIVSNIEDVSDADLLEIVHSIAFYSAPKQVQATHLLISSRVINENNLSFHSKGFQ